MLHKLILAAVLLGLGVPCVSGAILATDGAADGMIGRDWYGNPNYYWVDNTSTSVSVTHDGGNRWWYRGLVIIDISSLTGKTSDITDASFNFYSQGFAGVNLQYGGGTGPELTTGYGQISGTNIASLDGSTGWKSYNVLPFVLSGVSNGYQHIGFVFNAVVNYGGGSLASAEGGQAAFLDVTVPEPASLSVLALGGLALLLRRRCAA